MSTVRHQVENKVDPELQEKLRILPAPSSLNEVEQRMWEGLVDLAPLGHFSSVDVPLLMAYCKLAVQVAKLSNRLKSNKVYRTNAVGVPIDPVSRAFQVSTRQLAAVGLRLGVPGLRTQKTKLLRDRIKAASQAQTKQYDEETSPRFGLMGSRVVEAPNAELVEEDDE